MNRTILLAVLTAVLVPAVLWAGGNRENDTDTPDEERVEESAAEDGDVIQVADAVARVNGELIGRAEFQDVVESNILRYETQSGQAFSDAQRPQLERQVLDGLIMRTILEQEAARLDVSVTEERFEQTFSEFRSQFPNESAYLMALEEQGFTDEEFRAELRRQMVIEQLIRTEVYDQVTVTDDEIVEFYDANPQYFQQPEQVAARHIILTTEEVPEDQRAALQGELREIRQEIVDGADFGEMAQEHSQGPSAAAGGDLGTFGRGQMVPAFEEAAFALEVGEISDVIETQFGYHILQVTERIPASTQSLEDARARIEEFLLEDARNQGAQAFVSGLRVDAEVEELIEIDAPQAPAAGE